MIPLIHSFTKSPPHRLPRRLQQPCNWSGLSCSCSHIVCSPCKKLNQTHLSSAQSCPVFSIPASWPLPASLTSLPPLSPSTNLVSPKTPTPAVPSAWNSHASLNYLVQSQFIQVSAQMLPLQGNFSGHSSDRGYQMTVPPLCPYPGLFFFLHRYATCVFVYVCIVGLLHQNVSSTWAGTWFFFFTALFPTREDYLTCSTCSIKAFK